VRTVCSRFSVGAFCAAILLTLAAACTSEGSTVEVPNVVGMKVSDAESSLRAVGLEPRSTAIDGALLAEPAHRVLAQEPAAGTTVDAGTQVSLSFQATEDR